MLRFRAWKLTRMICLSFREKLFSITTGGILKYKNITIFPSNHLGKTMVLYKDQEIWLPLLCRLVLKRNVRKYFINQALEKTFGL